MHPFLRPASLLLVVALGLAGCASHQDSSSVGPSAASGSYAVTDPGSDHSAGRLQEVFARYEGTPYRYGGTNARGFDCSGFIGQAYLEAFGIQLPRTTTQLLRTGDPVAHDELQPGDLVFFTIRGKEQHAGIFVGDNRFIHASTSVGVTQSSLDGFYWRDRFTQARRFD